LPQIFIYNLHIKYNIRGANIKKIKWLTIISIFVFTILIFSNINCNEVKAFKKNNSNALENYDLVIIAPYEFSKNLQPLIEHKNSVGIKTKLIFVESIYNFFEGRDKPEQIKYFIKYALENWSIKYVLLVGDVNKIPIRTTYSSIWPEYEPDIISDHYYADIYDENDSFCSWDSNGNDRFGEILIRNDTGYEYYARCPDCWKIVVNVTDIDGVDLYPDVIVGRLPCSKRREVNIVVNKIIRYEKETCFKSWFKKIILMGGDDHPEFEGAEGEIETGEVAQQLPDFEHIILWESKQNLNVLNFNREMNKGVGFVSYSGHGTEFQWAAYAKNSEGKRSVNYYTPYIRLLRNQNKLPIMFFSSCLMARLDFTFNDLTSYKPLNLLKILTLLPGLDEDTLLPCFAWSFVKKKSGGAIATIGSTRVCYGYNDGEGVRGGGAYLNVHFFKAYHEGVTIGEMFTQSQKDYLDNVLPDYMTLEEFILIGDPSLRVGGYSN